MKLTIKLENGSIKVVELNKDLEFTVAKGEQYVFSNGFTNYVLNFKDDQESIVLVFNIDGKSVQVILNGIVPHLQDNIPGMESPTAVIINKNVDDESLDTIMENTAFNGSEILDQLALLSSKPIELGLDGDDSLSLITSFESLVGSLGAAAAGPDAGGDTNSDGSTFNTIFGNIDDPLSPIATSDSWVNLPESISSTGIETDGTPVIPTISISDSTVNETARQISFIVTLDRATTNNVVVNYSTQDGTAQSGLDYTASSGRIIFLKGETSKTINITVNNDNIYEISENLVINLDTPINATISDNQATGTIIDTTLPSFSIHGVEVVEGDYAVFTVDLDSASARDITISLATKDGSATSNDYLPQTEVLVNGSWVDSSTVTIPAGDISVQVRVKTLNDALKEPLETFDLEGTLSSGLTSNLTASGTSSISDNNIITSEDTALVSIAGEQTIVEGETSTDYTVKVDQAAGNVTTGIIVKLIYTGVAADGTDFNGVTEVTIPAGSNETTFKINTIDDNIAEGSEKFTITIGTITDTNFENIVAKTGSESVTTTITDESVPTDPDAQTATVSLVGPGDVVEGEQTTDYTVTITEAPKTDLVVTFNYTTTDANGDDYTAVGSVTIKANETSAKFKIDTIDDNIAEGSEDFTVSINTVQNGGLEDVRVSTTQNAVTTTITDESVPTDPDAQTATVSLVGPGDVVEGEQTTDYTVTITEAPKTDLVVTFNYTTTDANGDDYTAVGSVTIKANETSAKFKIDTIDDNIAEGSEDFTVSINTVQNGGLEDVRVSTTQNAVTTTITDESVPTDPDAQTATVSLVGPGDVVEGEQTTDYTVTITEAPKTDLVVTFNYTTTDANGDDYTAVGSVTIKANETSAKFKIDTIDDNIAEGSEDFTVSINTVQNGGLEDVRVSTTQNAVTTTITDESVPTDPDAQTATVSLVGPGDVVEGEQTTDYTVTITEAPKTDLVVTFNYTTTDANGDDYTAVGSVTIKANETSAKFKIDTIDDNIAEGSEDFTVSINTVQNGGLEDVRVSTTQNAVTTTITDESVPTDPDAQTATVSLVGPGDVVEGEQTTDYTVTITEAPKTDLVVTFNYTTTDANGDDYTAVGSVTIKANETSAKFKIDTIDDNIAEGSEDFTVSINTVQNGGLEDVRVSTTQNAVTTTITDESVPTDPDAQTATVSLVGPGDVVEGEQTTDYTVTITEAPKTDLVVTFNYTTTDANGDDYTAVGSVTIKANETSAKFKIDTIDDNIAEGSEDFTVSINTVQNGGLEDVRVSTTQNAVTTTITDESVPTDPDAQTATVSLVGPGDVVEGEQTTDYTVTITEAPKTDLVVTFNYTTTDANGDDYTAVGSVTIKANETSAKFKIDTIDDNIAEGSEDFTVSINTVQNGGLEDVRVSTTQNAVTTTITDESVPTDPDAQTATVSLVGPGDVVEGEQTTDYTVTITEAPKTDLVVTFNYTTTDANGDDYTAVGSVTIKANETSAKFKIDTIDDNIAEGSEDFTVSINTVQNGGLEDVRVSTTQNAVTTTITDESVPTDPDAQTATVSLVGPGDVVEGEQTTDYTVTITEAPKTDLVVTFNYTTTDANGDDYTAVGSVTIKANETSAKFKIDTIDDNIAEGSEDFTVSINTVQNGGLEDVRVSTTQNAVTTTITDESVPTDPDAQTATVSLVGPGDVVEGEQTTDYTVTITEAPKTDLVVTFNYTTTDANGDDYTAVGSVTIKANETSAKFKIDTIDDNIAEGSEDFTVSINTVQNGGLEDVRVSTTQNAVTTTITDESVPTDPDAQTATVSLVGPGDVVEGEQTTDYTVTITEAPKTDLVVTFNYTTTDANGDDYTAVGSVTIKANETSAKFKIDTIDDNIAEGSEDFTVSINTVQNGGLEDVRVSTTQNAVTTTITDESVPTDPDAQTATVSLVGPGDVVEGEQTTDYTVTITEAPKTDLVVTFNYTTTDANGDDYTAVGSVTIKANETSAKFKIDTIDDNIAEGSEDFTVSINTVQNGGLEDVRVSTTQNAVTTTITDESVPTDPDAQTATVSLVGPGDVVEGEQTTDYTVTITEAPKTDLVVTFNYTTTDANGDDYTAVGSVTIKANETSAKFKIDTIDDNIAEGSEDFTVSINTVQNGGLEDVRVSTTQNAVTTTITDESVPTDPDAQTATVSLVGPGDVVEGEQTTDYTVTITEAPKTDLVVTFNYTTTDANGDDYTAVGSVTIKANETSAKFKIDTIDDNIAEGSEDFTVSINTVQNGGLEDVRVSTTQNAVTTTITDESVPTDPDAQTATVSLVGPGDVVEGEQTTDYTVTITEAPKTDLVVTFNYTTTDANGDDYTAVGSVTIKANETSAKFKIDTIDDNIAEGSEDFTVSINTVQNGGLEDVRVSTTQNAVTTTITDESVPTDPDAQTATVSLVGPGDVVEGEQTTDYTVTITEAPKTDLVVTFNYTTTDANGDDYTAVGSVTIKANETSAKFKIDTIDDNIAEGSEDFTVSINTVQNGGLEDVRVSTTQNAVTTTITDESVPTDPDAQTATVSLVGPGDVVEGEQTTDYTVTITEAPKTDLVVTFNYTTTDANGDDYTAVGSVTIKANETSAKFKIDTIDDNIAEGSEDFTVSINTVQNGGLEDVRVSTTQNAVTTTITDESVPTDPDAQTATVSLVGPGDVVEGEQTTDYTVTITEAPKTDLVVTFNYTTTDANGDDYTAVGSVTIKANETSAKFKIDTIDDNIAEGSEDFTVSINTVQNGGLEDVRVSTTQNAVTTTITDESVPTDPDAQTATVSLVGPGDVVEGEQTTDYTVTITEAPKTDLVVTFNYTTTDANGDDYTAVGSVTIKANETSAKFKIDTIDDNIAEGSEDFTVSINTVQNGGLEDVRVSTTQNAVTTTITDESVPTDPDAQTATVSLVGPGDVVEGEQTTDYTVTITEAPKTDLVVTFNYTTTDANGDDYTAVGSVTIKANETSAKFKIDTIDDNIAEGSEDFTVSINTVQNGGLEDVRVSTTQNAVTTTITDESVPTDPDAQTATVSLVGPGDVVEGEQTTDYTVTITEAPKTDLVVTFNYTTTDANGDDYTAVGSVTIKANETSAKFKIDTIDDNIAEGSEDFTVSINTVQNGGLEDVRVSTTQNAVTTTITDESVPTDPDAQTATVSLVGPGDVVEGEQTTDYTVTITEAPKTDLVVTFNYTTTDANGDDYTAVGSVTIKANETSAKFKIDTIDDNIAEGSEDFTVSINTVQNGGLEDVRVSTTQNAVTTTITDESVPTDPDAQTATVSLVGPGDVVEGEQTTDYTVTITEAPKTDLVVTFNYTTTDANGDDYTAVGSVTIKANETSAKFKIDTIDDNIAEGSEDFTVSINTVQNGGLEDVRVSTTQNAVTTTITDESVTTDPDAQTATVSLVGPGDVVEGEQTTDYTVTITEAPKTDLVVTFNYTTTDANGDDYTAVGSVTIKANETSAKFKIDTIDDNIAEGSEDFTVSINTVQNGGLEDVRVSTTQNAVTTTITDESVPTDPDAQTATVSLVGPGDVVEGEQTTDYTVTITEAPKTDLVVTFNYTTTDANGDDYTAVGSVTIKANETSAKFKIDTIDDNIAEGSEDFTVSINTVQNGGLEDVRVSTTQNAVTTTITDESVTTDPDAQTATVSLVGPGDVVEGEQTTDYTVTITEAPKTDLVVTFNYTTTDANGDDYTAVGSVTIKANETSAKFKIDTIDDNIAEGSEDFTVSINTVQNGGLEDVRVSTTQNAVTTTITDESVTTDPDAQTATVSLVGPGDVVEGEQTTDYTVTITEAPKTDLVVTFNYTTTDANGDDYTAVGSVTIKANETSAKFKIDTIDDNIAEGSEDFTVSINTVQNGGLEDVRVSTTQNAVTTTITDESVTTDPDAQTATVSLVGPGDVVEGEQTTDYTVTITEAPKTDLVVTFNYTTTDANGDDYTAVGSVTIKANETSAKFKIDTIDDNIAEGSEDFTVSINTVQNGGLEDVRVSTTQNAVTTTITDESVTTDPDAQTATVSLVGPGDVVEGEQTTDYTVTITEAPKTDLVVTFNYTTTDANGDDYTAVGSVTIKANETSAKFKIDTIDDNIAEGSEDFTVSINTVQNGGLEDVRVSTTQNAVTTTITDESVTTDPDAQTATVSLVGPGDVVEGEQTTDYTVTITEAPKTDLVVTFNYTTTDANGDDYTAVGSVTIKANETSAKFKIDTIDDNIAEGSEDFTVSINTVQNGGLEDVRVSTTQNAVTTTITDESVTTDPDAQTATVSLVGPGDVVEGEQTTDYTVTITEAPKTDLVVTFNYTTTDANGDDYTAVGSVTIKANETSAKFKIDTIDDNIAEGSEDFTVSINTVQNGGLEDVRVSTTQNAVTTTITDESVTTDPDAQTATVSLVGPGDVVEGEQTTDYTVTITEAPKTDLVVTFNYTTTDANGDDYTAVGSVTIKANETSAKFKIDTIDDNIAEGSEDFTVSINTVQNGGLEDVRVSTTQNAVTTTITDESVTTDPDAQTATVSLVGPGDVVEGEQTTDYTVTITEAPKTDLVVTFNYTTTDANGDDYTAVGSVTIKANETSAKFKIDTIDDNIAEGSEDFTVSINTVQNGGLEDVRVSTTQNAVTTTITDESVPTDPDAQTATVSLVGPGDVVEGEQTTDYTVTITEAPKTDLVVTFNYTTTDANGDDYTAVGSVTIKANETSAKFKIDTIDDNIAEGSEDFTVSINTVQNGGLEDVRVSTTQNAVTTTIVDNDRFSMDIESVQVDEDALLGTDDLDNYDPDIKEFTGSLGLNVDNLAEVNLMFEGGQSTSLTSKGEMIDINYSNNNETIKGVSKDGREIFEITLDESTGEYTFKLKDVVDHPDVTSEDLISNIDFNIIAVRGSDITASKINISIADDIPTANTVVIDADSQYTETTTNIVIGIDTSGSMGTTKMNLAKEAAIKLIEKYEQMGNVNVKVVEFNTNASATTWFTNSQSAKDSINGLSAGGYTNYEDTLRQTIDTFDTTADPKPSADQDIFYMLSDGDPTKGDMNGSDGISGIVPEWKTFAENNFDDVYSIGIGTNVDLDGNSRGSLDQIADVANGHDTFVVKNVNELTDELLATIVNVNGVLVINTGGNELDFSFGADGPADGNGPKLDGGKLSFTWGDGDLSDGAGVIINNGDGTGPNLVWSVFNNGKVILGKDAVSGQVLVKIEANNVNSDNPTYEVTQFVPNTGITKVEVPFTVVDGDGDGATANLSIDIDSDFKAFVKLTGDSTAVEADGATLEHTLSLVDQNGTAINLREGQVVTVELKYENDSTESNDFASAKTITAVITGTVDGVNTVQIINNIQNDSVYEGDESYTLSIESISSNVAGLGTIFAHETNGVKDSVTGTITDEFDNIKAEVSIVDSDDINTVVDASSGTVESAKITGAINFGDTITKLVVTNGSQKVEIDPANVTVQPDGTFTIENVDVSTLNDGVLTVELEVQNSSGNTASDTDTVSKDTIAEISITSASIDHMTGLASGTVTDVEPGRTISIKFIDDGGYEVRTTTTVKPDGTWEISEDVSSLTHGNIKIGVFVNDNAGNPGQTCEEDIGVLNTVIANDDYGKDVEQGEIVIAKAVNADQGTPDITYLEDGGYVVVWEEVNGASYNGAEYNNDTESTQWATRENHDIFSQRFDKDGEPVGDAIQVNTHDARDQHDANVTALPNGRYLVTWTSDDDYINVDNYDNSSRYIKARIYDEHNNPVCNEFTVARAEYDPIVGLPDGGFIVTWSADARHNNTDQGAQDNPIHSDVHDGSEYGVFGQRYDEFGNAMGDKFQINTHTLNDQMDSDITLDSNGDVVITWQSENQDGSSYGIYTQKFELTSNGVTKVGDEKQVNTTTNGSQTDPEITALTDGKAVITWESGTDVYAQILDENGAKVGMELDVTTSSGVQSNPVVTAISTGFIITWQSNENGNHDIYSQRFNSSGSEIGDKVKVNSSDISDQVEPTITTLSDGGYIIAWQNGDNISAQRFNADGTTYKVNSLDLDEDTSITIDVADLMANDTDPESHNFKITAVSNAQNGTVVLNDTNNDGTYDSVTFTPNEDYNGPATFVYTLTDEKGAVDTATVHLDVKPKGEPSVFVGTLCDADVKGHDITVNEGEDAILAVRVSGAEAGTTLSLTLSDGTALNTEDYNSTFYYAFVSDSTDMNNITWIEYTGAVNVPEDSSRLIVKTVTVDDSNDEVNELYNLTATLSTGETNTGTVTIVDNDEPGTPPEANDRHIDLDCSTDTYTAGLKSEYYGVDSQIHNLTEFKAIVDGNDPDATFTATNINYGYGTGSVGLGTNLQSFLKGDASSLSNDPSDSSDAGIKLYGKVFLAAGTYNFKVYSDDGYDIKVNGQNVANFESNQSPATKVHDEFTIAEDGYYDIEMLWWDQGGAYVFQPQISSDGGATYKFLDSSMLFTEDTSSNDETAIEFKMEDFVSDVEDDASSTIVKIRIDSLPEDGVLTVNGTAVKVGDIYDETTVIKYTANSNIEDTLYGTTANNGTIAEWGTITNGVITTADGNATIKAYNNGVIGEVGFSSENNNNSHDGLGLGVVSPDGDDDQIEGSSGEKLVVEFKEIVTNAEIGLSSLGTYFTSDSIDSKAHWVAFKNGVEVASGDVQQSTGDSNDTTNSFKIDTEFDKIEFTSVSTLNANYSIQYMNIDYKVDDSFDYVAIDSDDNESAPATITFDIDTTGECSIDSCPSYMKNVIGYWTLGEETGSNADDKAVLDNDATLHGSYARDVDSPINDSDSATQFWNGNKGWATIEHNDAYELENGTISFWMKDTGHIGENTGLFSKDSSGFDNGGHLTIMTDSDGSIKVRLQSDTGSYEVKSAAGSISLDEWAQVSFSFGDEGMKLYLNGTLVDTDSYTGGIENNTSAIALGASSWGTADSWDTNTDNWSETGLQSPYSGLLDEVAIFDRALSDSEITTYNDNSQYCDKSGNTNDTVTLSLEGTVSNTIIIDEKNVESPNGGYVVTALNSDGTTSTISKVLGTNHDGFGVNGAASGADTEIGYESNVGSEVLKIEFDNEVSSVDVDFAWKHSSDNNTGSNPGETALIEFYKNGIKIDSQEQYDPNHTDTVDENYVLTPTNGESFDEIRFLANGDGDDYLINKLEYVEVVTSNTEVNTKDDSTMDFSITSNATGSIIVSELISGMTISDGVNSFTATDSLNLIDVISWNYSSLEVTLPNNMALSDYNLNVTASNGSVETSKAFTIEISDNYIVNDGKVIIDDNESVDLNNIILSDEIDTINLENNGIQKLNIDLDDVIDLTNSDNELVIKGDLSDKVDLDNTEWTNSGTQEIDGSNYNVYTGLGANSTVKLLIDDDIEITPDI